jgi:hypothetical protein
MQTHAPIRKAGGRLSREDQRRLGDILQRVYDDVIRQGVPDRFRNLLDELEEGAEGGQRATGEPEGASARAEGVSAHGRTQRGHDPDRVVEAKSFPQDKGSN